MPLRDSTPRESEQKLLKGRRLLDSTAKKFYLLKAYCSNQKSKIRSSGCEGDIIILTMGKVGSMTLKHSLNAVSHLHRHRIQKAHFISREGEQYYEHIFHSGYASWSEFPRKTKLLIARRALQAREIRRDLARGTKCKFVTVVRDPVATNLSGFFHNYLWWPNELQKRCRSGVRSCVDDISDQFLKRYPHQIPITWFDMELTGALGIDFYADEFPASRGYKIYQGPHADVLVLRLENLNACAGEAFREFLGIDDFHLVRMNQAEDKWYNKAYQDFKRLVALPNGYLTEMYAAPWCKQFYRPHELTEFRQRWRHTQA